MSYPSGPLQHRKSRSRHYRLPLGAISCVFIWFLWIISTQAPVADLNTILKSAVSCSDSAIQEPDQVAVYDYRKYPVFTSEVKKKVRGAVKYFAINRKARPGTPTCARIFLPENTCYQDFMSLAEVVQEEGLAMKMEKESVLVGN